MALQDEQAPIDIEIVNGAISSSPEYWNDFYLLLEYEWAEDPDDLGNVKLSLQSNEDNPDLVTPGEGLFIAVQKLNKLFYRYGISWIDAKYRIYQDDSEKWNYETDFQY